MRKEKMVYDKGTKDHSVGVARDFTDAQKTEVTHEVYKKMEVDTGKRMDDYAKSKR